MEDPTFVLVHGAWHGAWCWRELCAELDRRGVAWRTVDLPSGQIGVDPTSDLAADATVVIESAADLDGPVVLVGHSYGGAVITEAAPRVANLERMVYIAALVPEVGQSPSESARTVRVRSDLDNAITVDGPLLRLDLDPASSALYHDCSPEIRQWATSKLSTQTLASFRSARQAPSTTVPTRYLLCLRDHALDPAVQEVLALRCDQTIELDSDHCPFLSHPVELCDALFAKVS